jgi:hypothetical protein
MPTTVDLDVVLSYLNPITVDANWRIISLRTLLEQWSEIKKELCQGQTIAVEKTDEGITTLWHIVTNTQYAPWIRSGRLRLITSSDADTSVTNFNAEHFLAATIGSQEVGLPLTYTEEQRPYSFLFTNRKIRPHRRYLILELQKRSLLDHALWSCLEGHNTQGHPDHTRIYADGISMPVKKLDAGYDPDVAPDWIDGVIYPRQYQHTWFTLVSETAFEYPYSFRTEKIWKPILAGHPFLVCANTGFYRDLRNLGFRTFDRLIDESFDSIIHGKDRLARLIDTVAWLCRQDLAEFWRASREVCLYNHQRALELHNSLDRDFTTRLLEFMNA